MKESKGFTLIELLAVIVILALIALITTPMIIDVIEKSKKGALEDSAYGLLEAANIYYTGGMLEEKEISKIVFTFQNGKQISNAKLSYKGKVDNGSLRLYSDGATALCITGGGYVAIKNVNETQVTMTTGGCVYNEETESYEIITADGQIKGKNTSPVGEVISYMGNHAPEGYLICDGTVYNIADYQDLADQIKKEFGSYNYFGGNGTTTFAVPDLRGEFLRGSGTNSHTNQGNGSDVGIHQDATVVINPIVEHNTGRLAVPYNSSSNLQGYNFEGSGDSVKVGGVISGSAYLQVQNKVSSVYAEFDATRPTNTSVLYCIKY